MLKNRSLKKLFPVRKADTHKGDYGKVFILAGSEGMLGAAVLCSRAALRSGAGLVYLAIPKPFEPQINLATPEIITTGEEKINLLAHSIKKMDAVAIGPGLGARRSLVRPLLFEVNRQKLLSAVVLDADALNAFVGKTGELEKLQLKLILTPHPGEMAKLLGIKTEEVQKNRKKIVLLAAKKFNCMVVLKGYKTIVADQSGRIYINQSGNPGMATAGAGDVLTGMIVSFLAQGLSSWDAAVAGVYLHGLAGDLAAKEKGQYGMIASDIIEQIPYALQKIN